MNVIVQLDKEEYDKLEKQASANRNDLDAIAMNVALSAFENFSSVVRDSSHMDQVRDYLLKKREEFNAQVRNQSIKAFGYEP